MQITPRIGGSMILGLVLLLSTTGFARATGATQQQEAPAYTMRALADDCRTFVRVMNEPDAAKNIEIALNVGTCLGYLRGVTEAYNGDLFCLPGGANYEQLARVFVKFADEHPGILPESSFVGFNVAMKASFPCENKDKKEPRTKETRGL